MAFQIFSSLVLATLLCLGNFANAQGTTGNCDPLTATCPAFAGIATGDYSIDFTEYTTLPPGWILANYENATFGPNGAEFTYNKLHDAPFIWTEGKFLFGSVDVVMQAAEGVGIISSSVLISDDNDEIDWELSGNNFGYSTGRVQTNYFGKGVEGNFDRGTLPVVDSPQTQFHTYSLNWSPTSLVWSIDGTVVRTLLAADANDSDHQYPQTPMRLQLGLWNGGDPSNAAGTIAWATGGVPSDLSKAPFKSYVKSVRIQNTTPCASYQYTDKTGSAASIQCVVAANGINSTSSTSYASVTTAPASTQPSSSTSEVSTTDAPDGSASDSTYPSPRTTVTLTSVSASSNPGTITIDVTTCSNGTVVTSTAAVNGTATNTVTPTASPFPALSSPTCTTTPPISPTPESTAPATLTATTPTLTSTTTSTPTFTGAATRAQVGMGLNVLLAPVVRWAVAVMR